MEHEAQEPHVVELITFTPARTVLNTTVGFKPRSFSAGSAGVLYNSTWSGVWRSTDLQMESLEVRRNCELTIYIVQDISRIVQADSAKPNFSGVCCGIWEAI